MKFSVFIITVLLAAGSLSADKCGPCDAASCQSDDSCLAGLVMDSCDCCQVCARSEGELCDMQKGGELGVCGDNLDCRKDEETGDQQTCVCTQQKMVCGSDKLTYSSPCQLNEESTRRLYAGQNIPELRMDYWGPCIVTPVIVTSPQDTVAPMGQNITLDCEAKGFPAPVISWQYDSVDGDSVSLPSDDQMISVQMRGGPEPYMATGWAQIISLDPTYSGTYHCIASNSEGKVHASAKVGVYNEN